ncbi:hypothetical protein EWM62_05855 [Mucilaginibacter terrigena]|uniref:DUF5723 domain-containing protein n=1 Tax=Mucilaginibacter terrigena TaxID=2492395 RepID=A0A4Q5LPY5_9SPHI|nr:DUF5723 family protein [Mucilaginibacter terrigena]RYU91462.1 hypothetical protein EWM62_05855 [Mucilaginibacter terrigena]
MKNFLLAICFLFISVETFGQQFSQYNTGTLYDSFENPARAAFIPDTTYKIAFNFFIPNFNSNLYLTGNGQVPLKSRAFDGKYLNTGLTIEQGRFSRANLNANVYTIMFKVFTSLDGNSEVGFSTQTRAEGRGLFTDESLLLLNGSDDFKKDDYSNILNNSYTFQTYHQISASYREKISKNFAFGVKLSALLGIQYQKLDITQSHIQFDRANDAADITLQGQYRINYTSGEFNKRDIIPSLRNPGAAISIGTAFKTRDNFNIQFNVKDLGFIHWSKRSIVSDFNTTRTVPDINTYRREDNLYATTYTIIRSGDAAKSFITPTNGKLEISANKSYWFDYDKRFKYSPTVILQKEVFYDGYTAALVNPVQYNNFVGTLSASYNNYGIFSAGLQFMVKAPNAEFYIGSDRLMQSVSLAGAAGRSDSQINKNTSFTGADFFLGFSLKFGQLIEHPMNSSHIPLGDRPGFLKRLWNSIFHPGRDLGD